MWCFSVERKGAAALTSSQRCAVSSSLQNQSGSCTRQSLKTFIPWGDFKMHIREIILLNSSLLLNAFHSVTIYIYIYQLKENTSHPTEVCLWFLQHGTPNSANEFMNRNVLLCSSVEAKSHKKKKIRMFNVQCANTQTPSIPAYQSVSLFPVRPYQCLEEKHYWWVIWSSDECNSITAIIISLKILFINMLWKKWQQCSNTTV